MSDEHPPPTALLLFRRWRCVFRLLVIADDGLERTGADYWALDATDCQGDRAQSHIASPFRGRTGYKGSPRSGRKRLRILQAARDHYIRADRTRLRSVAFHADGNLGPRVRIDAHGMACNQALDCRCRLTGRNGTANVDARRRGVAEGFPAR